ncbi:uncharacterized protein LOC114721533 [Neltuma alba]|uniref:uncharacterized protein LOC114721533 n=1 Tax=Neltuma alba TaxID=207710 RepID=UPI0010A4267F|nr:uncharacterized protein LOC114721533 [Prosopis alba]
MAQMNLPRKNKATPRRTQGNLFPVWPRSQSFMIIASWNCRGAGGRGFSRILKEIVNKHHIDVFCLVEPRISGNRADTVMRKLGFSHWIRIEASGFAGGIWCLWNDAKIKVQYLSSNTQILHCSIFDSNSQNSSLVSFVYGETTPLKRKGLWDSISSLAGVVNEPWILLGDFNAYLSPHNKTGGGNINWNSIHDFNNCINSCGLQEVPVVGDIFTWERGAIKERLDWTFCNSHWADANPTTKIFHLLRFKSDHRVTFLVDTVANPSHIKVKHFRYNAAWAMEESFSQLVAQSWENSTWQEGSKNFAISALA